jgi:hypothetical protein
MSAKQKTILRTVRIRKDLDELLQKDAKAKKTSVNGLIAAVMTKYSEWDRFADKFGYVSLPKNLLRDLLDATDDETLLKLAGKFGAEHPNEVIHFWFKRINLETLLGYIRIHSEYCNLGQVEIESDDRGYTIRIHHDYGKKWTEFLERFFDNMWRTYLNVTPHFETTENTITLKFQLP